MRNKHTAGSGIILVMTVLMCLVLVLFSLLAFSAARNDYALSQRMVALEQEYYAADAIATEQLQNFGLSNETSFATTIPIGELHSLEIAFERQNGQVVITKWNTVITDDSLLGSEDYLPLWGG
jgi:hypothetical protein